MQRQKSIQISQESAPAAALIPLRRGVTAAALVDRGGAAEASCVREERSARPTDVVSSCKCTTPFFFFNVLRLVSKIQPLPAKPRQLPCKHRFPAWNRESACYTRLMFIRTPDGVFILIYALANEVLPPTKTQGVTRIYCQEATAMPRP